MAGDSIIALATIVTESRVALNEAVVTDPDEEVIQNAIDDLHRAEVVAREVMLAP